MARMGNNRVLKQNETNRVVMTLSESVTLTGTPVNFLFRLIDETTHNDYFFTAPDVSPNIVRYNQFNITLTGASYVNLTAGTINLAPSGMWKYEVYQMYDPSNLSLTGTTGDYIENGIVTVTGTTLSAIQSYYTGFSETYTYHTM